MTDFDPDKLKHKPNEKHTLEEVLKSLQDLIHNDLLRGETQRMEEPAAPEPDPAPATEEAPTAAAPEEADPAAAIPDVSIPAADMPLGAVVQSLEELVKNDLALPDEMGQIPAAATPDPEPPAAPAPAPAAPAAPATGQQAFAFDDADTATPAEPEPAPELAAPNEPEPLPPSAGSSDFDEFTVDLAPPPDISAGEEQIATPEMQPDDLPVLTDAVSETAAPPADGLPVLEEIALESPDNSRDGGGRAVPGTAAGDSPAVIAARVVARLNAERRARGAADLDEMTLVALRALLREEIERDPPER
jgi:hypothetical protein